MAFDTLSLELQNILLVQHSYLIKWFVFFVIMLLSAYYVFVVWKSHEQTKFITVAILRMFYYSLGVVYLATSPLMILLLSPEYDFYSFYSTPLIIYSVWMSWLFVLFFVDLIRFGPFVMLRLAGLDLGDSNVREIASQIEDSKHYFKLGWFRKSKKNKEGKS